jgi:hypothetical protein
VAGTTVNTFSCRCHQPPCALFGAFSGLPNAEPSPSLSTAGPGTSPVPGVRCCSRIGRQRRQPLLPLAFTRCSTLRRNHWQVRRVVHGTYCRRKKATAIRNERGIVHSRSVTNREQSLHTAKGFWPPYLLYCAPPPLIAPRFAEVRNESKPRNMPMLVVLDFVFLLV